MPKTTMLFSLITRALMSRLAPTPEVYPDDIRRGFPASEVDDERFDQLVDFVLDLLPDEVTNKFQNLAFVIEDVGAHMGLLGLFQGVPLTKKTNNQGGFLPDKITIYRDPIRWYCRDEVQLYEQIYITMKHEIGHYFGLDHDVLDKYGY